MRKSKSGAGARVLIPTTEGPAEIVLLRRENAALGRSTMCVAGGVRQTGVSLDYSHFVRAPSGVVEGLFGHGAFRMDMSSTIDVGASWQLGALIAHALEAEGRLSQRLAPKADPSPEAGAAETVVWATGQVRAADFAVGAVGHVRDKLALSLAALCAEAEAGRRVCVVAPIENAKDIPAAARRALEAAGVEVRAVDTAGEALDMLGLAPFASAASAPAPIAWTGAPYRGLEPYEPRHRAIFFGRARAREETVERLQRGAAEGEPFLLIHGRSGVGKSSLALAGLAGDVIERIGAQGGWRLAVARFGGGAPVLALAEAMARGFELAEAQRAAFVTAFARSPEDALAPYWARAPQRRVLLVLDQLEQAFADTAASDLDALDRVLARLASGERVWMVATMRTDRLHELEATPDLARLARDRRLYRLEPPSLFEIVEIILRPAALAGLSFDAGPTGERLPERLAESAIGASNSLPLLQIVLLRLAAFAEADGSVPYAAYDRMQGLEGAIGRWAEETTRGLEEAGRSPREIARALAELVRFDETSGAALSRSAPWRPGRADGGAREAILSALVEARLAISDGARAEPDADASVRLAHETLIEHWPRLTALVSELRQELGLRDRVEAAARAWERDGGAEADLWTLEARVAPAEALRDGGVASLSGLARRFVEGSRRRINAVAESKRRFGRRLLAAVGGSAALFAALFAWALDSAEGERRSADAARISTEAAERRAALLTADRAESLAEEGDVDLALLALLDASAVFVEGPASDRMLAAFVRVLDRAETETRMLIPAEAIPFGVDDALYFHTPSTGAVWRLNGATPPVETALRLPGRFAGRWRTTQHDGLIVASDLGDAVAFFEVDLESGARAPLVTVPRRSRARFRIQLGLDGVGVLSEDALVEAGVFATTYFNLATGRRAALDLEARFGLLAAANGASFLDQATAGLSLEDVDPGGGSEEGSEEGAGEERGLAARLAEVGLRLGPASVASLLRQCAGPQAITPAIAAAIDRAAARVDEFFTDLTCDLDGELLLVTLFEQSSGAVFATTYLFRLEELREKALSARFYDPDVIPLARREELRLPPVAASLVTEISAPEAGSSEPVSLDFVLVSRHRDLTLARAARWSRRMTVERRRMARDVTHHWSSPNGEVFVVLAAGEGAAADPQSTEIVVVDLFARARRGAASASPALYDETTDAVFQRAFFERGYGSDFCLFFDGDAVIAESARPSIAVDAMTLDTAHVRFDLRRETYDGETETLSISAPREIYDAVRRVGEAGDEIDAAIPCFIVSADAAWYAVRQFDLVTVRLAAGEALTAERFAPRNHPELIREGGFSVAPGPTAGLLLVNESTAVDLLEPVGALQGPWRRRTLFRAESPVLSAVFGPDRRRLYVVMLDENGFSQAYEYSIEAQRILRKIGPPGDPSDPPFVFVAEDEIVVGVGSTGYAVARLQLANLRAAARAALSAHCAFDRDDPSASPCWRANWERF